MASKRQLQIEEKIKRFFGTVLQEEGAYIYGHETLVSVTSVQVAPDLSLAKIYLSIYNSDDKDQVLESIQQNHVHLKQALVKKIRKHIRRIPELEFFQDDTLDEMYRLDALFDKLKKEE